MSLYTRTIRCIIHFPGRAHSTFLVVQTYPLYPGNVLETIKGQRNAKIVVKIRLKTRSEIIHPWKGRFHNWRLLWTGKRVPNLPATACCTYARIIKPAEYFLTVAWWNLTCKANRQISTSLVLKLLKIELFLIFDQSITVYPTYPRRLSVPAQKSLP